MTAALSRLRIPARNAALVPGQVHFQVPGQVQHLPGVPRGHPQHRAQLPPGELITAVRHLRRALQGTPGSRAPPDQLRDGGVLAGTGIGLDPVPRADHAEQLIIGGAGVPVVVPGHLLQERPEHRAPRRDIQRLAGGEPGGRARILPGEGLRGPGHPRAPPPGRDGTGRGQHRGVTQPRRHLRRPHLLRGDLPRLGDQRRQLVIIQPRRRRVIRVLIRIQVTGILILGPGGQPGLIPVRALRHQRPVRRPERRVITRSGGLAGRVAVGPGVAWCRCVAHVLRSVRKNDLAIKHGNEETTPKPDDTPRMRYEISALPSAADSSSTAAPAAATAGRCLYARPGRPLTRRRTRRARARGLRGGSRRGLGR